MVNLLKNCMHWPGFFVLLLTLTFSCHGLVGFDISLQDCEGGFSSHSTWNCFANEGFGFAVIQAVQGGNGETTTITSCVSGASRAGMYVSLYGWFCPNCYGQSNAYNTAYNVISDLKDKGIYPGRNYTYFYIDVEECDPLDNCWDDYATNRQYLLDLVAGAQDAGASVAIYSSNYEWKLLFGSDSWSDPSLTALPLWYANWNNEPNMSGFSSFGGWTSPHMHQFADACPGCCANVDQDYLA